MTKEEKLEALNKAISSLGFRIAALAIQLTDKSGVEAEKVSVKINRYGRTLEILENLLAQTNTTQAIFDWQKATPGTNDSFL
jgi:hypothetical protein